MSSKNLDVVPAALRAAAGVVAGHAQRAFSTGSGGTSADMAGVAASAFDDAFGGYCGQFSHRLSVASAALVAAAGAFTAMEDDSRAQLASIAPQE